MIVTKVTFATPAEVCLEHCYAAVSGVRLDYVTGGRKDGATVVLSAGFPESWYASRPLVPRLGERYWIIVANLPGRVTSTGRRGL